MNVLFNKSFCLRNADLLKVGVWLKNTNFENVILKKKINKRVECFSKLMLLYIFAFQNHISFHTQREKFSFLPYVLSK